MFAGKLIKAEEKEICFSKTLFELFSALFYPSPLLPKSPGFLRLIRSLYNAKFIPFYLVFKVE
jgi:hypothetical protein